MKRGVKQTIVPILALAMILSAFLPGTVEVHAEGGIPIDEINFPDKNFRDFVYWNLDSNRDHSLSQAECDAVEKIDVTQKRITDLKGIEYFTGLKKLNCWINELESLDLSKNTALEELICTRNKLTSLDVSQLTGLKVLKCSENKLTNLNISKNTALTVLRCSANQIRTLDVSHNTALRKLVCYENKLRELDVSQNTALTELKCYQNELTTLDVSQNAELERLVAHSNSLTSVKLIEKKYHDLQLDPIYELSVPKGTSKILFPNGFNMENVHGTVPGIEATGDGFKWDGTTEKCEFEYKLSDVPEKTVKATVHITNLDDPALNEAIKLVEQAEANKTEAQYNAAKVKVDALNKMNWTMDLENRLSEVKKYFDAENALKALEAKEAKDLTDEAMAATAQRVNEVKRDWREPLEKRLNDLKNKKTAFDPEHVANMAVKTQPSNLSYTEGDELNLAGLVVTLTDNKGVKKDVALEDFEATGITSSPAHKAVLADVDNGKKVKLMKGSLAAETEPLSIKAKQVFVDTKALQEKIGEAKALLEKSGQSDFAKKLQEVVADAEAVIKNPTDQVAVNNKLSELDKAMNALKDYNEKNQQKATGEKEKGHRNRRNNTARQGNGGEGRIFGQRAQEPATTENKSDVKHHTVVNEAYICGYEDGSFRPDGNMTRAEAIAMLARLTKLDTSDASRPNYMDVRGGWYNGAINAMVKAGYMKGYSDGTFRPDEKITRAEFAQMLTAVDKANRTNVPFADVKGHWALPAIEQAYANGRIKGYPDGSFRPNHWITRAESVTIVNRLFNRPVNEKALATMRGDMKNFKDISPKHWAYYQILGASNSCESSRE